MVDLKALLASLALLISLSTNAHEKDKTIDCDTPSIKCAKTITSAFSPRGDLWRVWTFKENLYFTVSANGDLANSQSNQVAGINEKISARGENRPKIGFDNFNGVYISWTKKRKKRFTADIRLIYSLDYGKTFSSPQTINDDGLLAGHSFNEMIVESDGKVSLIWLDSREKALAKSKGVEPAYNGSAIYLATGNPRKKDSSFKNHKQAQQTCQCCRLAFAKNSDNEYSMFWRHIYGDNIREFALKSLSKKGQINRISFDEWKINGCPHQGGALSIDNQDRHHMVWFNQGEKGKGIFYGYTDDKGKSVSTPLAIGNLNRRASHPHLSSNDHYIDIVWLEFSEGVQELWHKYSGDRGKTFSKATLLSKTTSNADRPFVVNYSEKSYVSWQQTKASHYFKEVKR